MTAYLHLSLSRVSDCAAFMEEYTASSSPLLVRDHDECLCIVCAIGNLAETLQ